MTKKKKENLEDFLERNKEEKLEQEEAKETDHNVEEDIKEDISEEESSKEEEEMTEESEINKLKKEVAELQENMSQEKDKALRAFAELENFKRRKGVEMDSFRKYASESFVLELLPVLDSFDRACEHAVEENEGKEKVDKKKHKKGQHKESMLDGFLLIQKQFHNVLEKMGVQPIEAIGKPFDANFHQAMMQEENKEIEPHTILKEVQKGYMLHDRVIRPAMVVVSK